MKAKGQGLFAKKKFSPALGAIVGKPGGSRIDAVKGVWAYIKKNKLNKGRNILFAGEHVNGARYAYTDGAYMSGVSAARAVPMMGEGDGRATDGPAITAMRILVHRSYVVDCANARGKRSRFQKKSRNELRNIDRNLRTHLLQGIAVLSMMLFCLAKLGSVSVGHLKC